MRGNSNNSVTQQDAEKAMNMFNKNIVLVGFFAKPGFALAAVFTTSVRATQHLRDFMVQMTTNIYSNFRKIILCFPFLICVLLLSAQNKKPVPIIFDSDMGPDYDDVGAITLLHAFADSGEARILATVASTKYEGVASVLDVFNTYFNRPDIPIGVPKGNAQTLRDWQHWTDTLIGRYTHGVNNNVEAEDAVRLYRKILAKQSAKSVVIVTIGFLTNLEGLLKSKADKYSALDGKKLVAEKVKQLVCMAGKFPEGYEFNVDRDIPASQFVFTNWPTNILFSGFEIGEKIKVGLPLINNSAIQNSPVKDVFRICIPMAKEDSAGRKSWDETAVMVAVKGVTPYYHLHYGHIDVANDGKNTWKDTGKTQAYLVEAEPFTEVASYINSAIMHQPVK
jgi:pyrimidine-specific ribonucleoside hydrolase